MKSKTKGGKLEFTVCKERIGSNHITIPKNTYSKIKSGVPYRIEVVLIPAEFMRIKGGFVIETCDK